MKDILERQLNSVIKQLSSDIKDKNCVFLLGAGVSMITPSNLPSGIQLKRLIATNLFDSKEFQHFFNILELNQKYKTIIPEVIFQEVYSIIGNRIYEIYEILKLSEANKAHQMFAFLSDYYNLQIYTTNFDLLIDQFIKSDLEVNHLHGSLDNTAEMTILIHQVGKKIDNRKASKFITQTKSKNLYVFGYSGNDIDIIDLINRSKVRNIYWLVRDKTNSWVLNNLNGLRDKSVFVFESEIEIISDKIISEFTIAILNSSNRDYTVERQEIINNYNLGVSKLEKYSILELILFRVQEYKEALDASKKALVNATEEEASYFYIWFCIYASDTINVIGENFNEGMSYIENGLSHSNIDEFPFLKGQLLNQKGIYNLRGENKNPYVAIENFKDSVNLFLFILANNYEPKVVADCMDFLGRLNNNIGSGYVEIKSYYEAISYFKRSLQFKKSLGDLAGITSTEVNIALTYLRLKNKSNYRYWKNKAMPKIIKYDMHYRHAYLLRQYGVILNNKYGLKALEEALQIYYSYLPDATYDIQITLNAIKMIKKE